MTGGDIADVAMWCGRATPVGRRVTPSCVPEAVGRSVAAPGTAQSLAGERLRYPIIRSGHRPLPTTMAREPSEPTCYEGAERSWE